MGGNMQIEIENGVEGKFGPVLLGRAGIPRYLAIALLFGLSVLGCYPKEDRGIGGVTTETSGIKVESASGKRVALVVGNGAYGIGPLRNPVNDASGMSKALESCGFEVLLKKDVDLESLEKAVSAFGDQIRGADCALFYFAGHGLQVNGENYLVPVTAEPSTEDEVKYRCVNAGLVMAKMKNSGARVSLMILDACRNNPFARSFRTVSQGLAVMDAAKGAFIAYATAPGSVAADGSGSNSVYTESLLKYLGTPGLKVEELFKQVRAEVARATNDAQVPWENTALVGDFYFTPPAASTATVAAPAVPPEAPTLVGHLQVAVNAPEAQVQVDGRPVGRATLNEALNVPNLPAGKTKVRAEAEGYEPIEKVVEIRRDGWTQEAFELAKVIVIAPESPRPPAVITPETAPRPTSVRPDAADQDKTTKIVDLGGGVTMELVWIPPGTFVMGSPDTEQPRGMDESPLHEVTISRSFWLGKYEVTQEQWETVMWHNPSHFEGDKNLPVESVSWNDCQEFIRKLNERAGGGFRLPTEAEWEYACRAGSRTPFHFGKTISTDQANYNGRIRYGDGPKGIHRRTTTPVGSFPANAWGLHDMHGNVWEWCSDWYGANYTEQKETDPQGPSSGEFRVLRGGSWNDPPGYCRAAKHGIGIAISRYSSYGLRVAWTP